jgi:hypothetical protein
MTRAHTNTTNAGGVSLSLLRYCLRRRQDIQRIYGSGALPLTPATNTIYQTRTPQLTGGSTDSAPIDLTAPEIIRATWGRNWESVMFIRRLLIHVFGKSTRLYVMVSHGPLIYALRLLGYIFNTMFVPDTPSKKHPVVLAT